LAAWDSTNHPKQSAPGEPPHERDGDGKELAKIGLSYTINLNLPATTEIEVFDAIFKSLRENLLRET
jgi:hypothetical protein